MTMENFETTSKLLDALRPYIGNLNVSVQKESNGSDYIIIDGKNNVGFEVFADEVIVYYFTSHLHFADYGVEPAEGEEDYRKRAADFLSELFQYQIRHVEFLKGKRLYSEQYYIVYQDGREAECIGRIRRLTCFFPLFARKSTRETMWRFDREKGCFTA